MTKETRPRGRPNKGIGERFKQVSIYLPPDVLDALDRLVDRRLQRSGYAISRTDVIRQAILEHLEKAKALPTSRGRKDAHGRATVRHP